MTPWPTKLPRTRAPMPMIPLVPKAPPKLWQTASQASVSIILGHSLPQYWWSFRHQRDHRHRRAHPRQLCRPRRHCSCSWHLLIPRRYCPRLRHLVFPRRHCSRSRHLVGIGDELRCKLYDEPLLRRILRGVFRQRESVRGSFERDGARLAGECGARDPEVFSQRV